MAIPNNNSGLPRKPGSGLPKGPTGGLPTGGPPAGGAKARPGLPQNQPNNTPAGSRPGLPVQGPQRPSNGPSAPSQSGRLPAPPQRGNAPQRPAERPQRPVEKSHTSEYDFDSEQISVPPRGPRAQNPNQGGGGQSRAPQQQRPPAKKPGYYDTAANNGRIVNPYDNEDDNTFSDVPIDEQFYEEEQEHSDNSSSNQYQDSNSYDFDNSYDTSSSSHNNNDDIDFSSFDEDLSEESQEVEPPAPKKKKAKSVKENPKDKKGQDVFIDEKNLKLKPFGGRKIKEGEFDDRANNRTYALVIQWVVIALIGVLIALGVKNALFPAKPLSIEEVAEIATIVTGQTNYPEERGKVYATDFIRAFLTTGDKDADQVLGFFYNGSLSEGDNKNLDVASEFGQEVLFGPSIYQSTVITENSSNYIVGSLVRSHVPDPEDNEKTASRTRWIFFSVNVYYDESSNRMYITPDSPTLVPKQEVGPIADVPPIQPPGLGVPDEETTKEIEPVIKGFMKGYAESTSNNYSSLEQYIINDAPRELKNGLGNEFGFSGGIDNALQFSAYPTEDSGVIKVLMNVNWSNALGGIKADYRSTYIATLNNHSGKWLVEKLSAIRYVEAATE